MHLADLPNNSPLTYSDHLLQPGSTVYEQACALGLEGVVSKRKDSHYQSRRDPAWMKVTCRYRDTFVIAGIACKGRKFDGAYLAEAKGSKLTYAGKVENGFSVQQVKQLQERAKEIGLFEAC